jgi:cell division protein FtsB
MTNNEVVSAVDSVRKDQEIERLRAENSALRPLVSDLQHKLRVIEGKCRSCEYHPGNQDQRA